MDALKGGGLEPPYELWFQIKIVCELKLAIDNDHANLILIWFHCHFQQNVKVSFYQNYWHSVIGFVCGSSTVLGVPKNVLLIYTVIKFICSLSTVLNTGSLSSTNVLPVCHHLTCL